MYQNRLGECSVKEYGPPTTKALLKLFITQSPDYALSGLARQILSGIKNSKTFLGIHRKLTYQVIMVNLSGNQL